ncbi:MAG: response regulator transcription factor, partial [Candidatus Roizmanbacteria bacterium]|nr:response regulator transcription factor [Candidatus Roizmanbacteria bacterium]
MRILVVEDDLQIAENLKKILLSHLYIVDLEQTGEGALFHAETQTYDLIILDWMLPDIDGIEVCKNLRKKSIQTPILILTAKVQVDNIVDGLESGADDYLTKPFSMDVLLARIKVLIRRVNNNPLMPIIRLGNLSLDTNKRVVMIGKSYIALAPKEYVLLEYLVMHKCKAIDRMELMEHVWGETIDEFSNTV